MGRPAHRGLARARPRVRGLLLPGRPGAAGAGADIETAKPGLRHLKAEAHLLIALADLGGVWDLDAVTGALTRFADAALQTALAVAAKAELEA